MTDEINDNWVIDDEDGLRFTIDKRIDCVGFNYWSKRMILINTDGIPKICVYSKNDILKSKNDIIIGFDKGILRTTVVMDKNQPRRSCFLYRSEVDDHILLSSDSENILNTFIERVQEKVEQNQLVSKWFNDLVDAMIMDMRRKMIVGINSTTIWVRLCHNLIIFELKKLLTIILNCVVQDRNRLCQNIEELNNNYKTLENKLNGVEEINLDSQQIYKQVKGRLVEKEKSLSKLSLCGLRLLTYHIEGQLGYKNMLKCFFGQWKSNWHRSAARSELQKMKEDHSPLGLQIACNIPSQGNMTAELQKSNKMLTHIMDINRNLDSITRNLNRSLTGPEDTIDRSEVIRHLQKFADLRHQIQSMSNEGEEFILVGDQSAGKSSLLSALLGVSISFVSDGCATRCPVRYVLEPCKPEEGWKYEYDNSNGIGTSTKDPNSLRARLEEHFINLKEDIISTPITVKIKSPQCTSGMTIVDLPGLVGAGRDKQKQHEQSHAVVKEYLEKKNVIVLYVHRFDVDIGSANTHILNEVQRRPPDQVAYCLTHFDRCCNDSDITAMDLIKIINLIYEKITRGRPMHLLCLAKKAEDIQSRESIATRLIDDVQSQYAHHIEKKRVYFGIYNLKLQLRRRMHKHITQLGGILQNYITNQTRAIDDARMISNSVEAGGINDSTLDKFIDTFRRMAVHMMRGRFIPLPQGAEIQFFEDISQEIVSGNEYCAFCGDPVWPIGNSSSMKELDTMSESSLKDDDGTFTFESDANLDSSINIDNKSNVTEPKYQDKLDPALKRKLVSHSLFTRTIYEIQNRLWSKSIDPQIEDISYAISSDPNINLDAPKDAAHSVMVHTIQHQLHMGDFFIYTARRLEYIVFKLLRYVIWSVHHSPSTPPECSKLLERIEFQAALDRRLRDYVQDLSNRTSTEWMESFDEIMTSPIILSHAHRYHDMLVRDFNWKKEEIEECTSEDVFAPRSVEVNADDIKLDDKIRLERIRKLIVLHTHIRFIMISEKIARSVDYNWRRMFDDTKESVLYRNETFPSIFEYIKWNVLKKLEINGIWYEGERLRDIYSGDDHAVVEEHRSKLDESMRILHQTQTMCELVPDLMTRAMNAAGNQFL
jgi:GTP-binding protein EngB required for normal cell division